MRHVVLAALAAVLAVPDAHAAPSTSGTLDLTQDEATLSYAWTDAPVLQGPDAAERVGLARQAIRASATRYVPVALRAFSLWPGPLSVPSCGGFMEIPGAQSAAITDARALVAIEDLELDVLRGRGTGSTELASTGADAYQLGEYSAPGRITVTSRSCTDAETGAPVPEDGSFHAVDELRAVGMSGSDRLLESFAPDLLVDEQIALRRVGGSWSGKIELAEQGSGSYPSVTARVTLTLAGTPAELDASCTLPAAMTWPGTSVRTRRAAAALLRRAGFTRVRYAGVRRGLARGMRGDYVVTRFSSSTLPCTLRIPFVLGRG